MRMNNYLFGKEAIFKLAIFKLAIVYYGLAFIFLKKQEKNNTISII